MILKYLLDMQIENVEKSGHMWIEFVKSWNAVNKKKKKNRYAKL